MPDCGVNVAASQRGATENEMRLMRTALERSTPCGICFQKLSGNLLRAF
jgi:hypothetical protein